MLLHVQNVAVRLAFSNQADFSIHTLKVLWTERTDSFEQLIAILQPHM